MSAAGDACYITADSESECDLAAPSLQLLRTLSRAPRSVKQSAELRLLAPAGSIGARRDLILLLLAQWKLQLVLSDLHPDCTLVETALGVSGADGVDGLRAVLASETIRLRRPRASELDDQSSSELDSMLADYWAQKELVAKVQADLDVLHTRCLHAAQRAGRKDLVRGVSLERCEV